jgi:predicted ribosome quality control (RQC) complex YloA/Tae2 family protein
MKALSQIEIENLIECFRPLLDGAQLQDILVNDRGLALGFRKVFHYWMILDLVPNSPGIYVFESECPFKKGKKPKPVGLFLNSHGKNLHLAAMEVLKEYGRVICLRLKNTKQECEIEVRLIPKQSNVLVRAQGRCVTWNRPLQLGQIPQVEAPAPRSIEEIHHDWLEQEIGTQKPALDPEVQWEKKRTRDLEKKRKALDAIKLQIESEEFYLWRQAGEYLKMHGTLVVPSELVAFVDAKKSLSWNIENCFSKSKQLNAKKEGARARLASVEQEILNLERAQFSAKQPPLKISDLMEKGDVRGRKLNLVSGAIAYCGRSANDNLNLLRKAKAWDYWLHLKDYPGAHAIIHRHRDQILPEDEILSVAKWVARESLTGKSYPEGQRVVVIFVECRFVRPIKGDKLGRVTYHSERTLSFTLRQS